MCSFEATNEEFAAEGYINVDIAMHRMLGKQIDAELLPCFGEAPLAIERDHVGVNTPTAVVVHQLEEFEGHFDGWGGKGAVYGGTIVVVDVRVLVMQSTVEYTTTQGFGIEHAGNEWLEFHIAMV